MKTLKTLTTLVALAAVSASIQAVPITGGLSIGGNFNTDNDAHLSSSTKFTSFSNTSAFSGDLVGVSTYPVTFTEKLFTYFPAISPSPVTDLFTFTEGSLTYHFDLTAVTRDIGDNNHLNLSGSGVFRITGGGSYDPTTVDWSFAGTHSGGKFSLGETADSTGTTVPDGGATAILLGLGMLGVGAMRRNRA